MTEINWHLTKFFKESEWPDGVTAQMEPALFHELFRLRDLLPAGCTMTPSPLRAAHVRQDGTSRHSIQNGTRKSDATDFFLNSWHDLLLTWNKAQAMRFGGIGLYVDAKLGGAIRPMMHLDMRGYRVMWIRKAGVYTYFSREPEEFMKILGEVI